MSIVGYQIKTCTSFSNQVRNRRLEIRNLLLAPSYSATANGDTKIDFTAESV